MKLVRYGEPGSEKPGLIDKDGQIRDLSQHIDDVDGNALSATQLKALRELNTDALPLVGGAPRLGPCVGNVGKLVCIGLNYSDHATEVGAAAPSEPVVFLKATSSISGPDDDIEIPLGSVKTDWEVELGIVIGKRAKYVKQDASQDHIAGYCLANDVSERAFQTERAGQWTKGKGHDTHGPIGPWLATANDIPDPANLSIWCALDGVRQQDGTTGDMIFAPKFLVSYLSQFMTLHPGDIILTGTPAGVGKGKKPDPVYIREAQVLTCGIEGLGVQRHLAVAPVQV
jgi:2-keto-4-pentenoate hydratase/2-oxohepta-3-ene-1,7-dioic acid hydratase in catechol pathway